MIGLNKITTKIKNFKSGEHGPDKKLIITVCIIIAFGLILLSSATSAFAFLKYNNDSYYLVKKQLFGIFIGLIVFWFFSRSDYHKLRRLGIWFLVFSIFLLTLVFIPGLEAEYGSARSWIKIFGYSLQPSELVKIFFLLYLAAWLENREKKLHDFSQGIAPFVIVLGIIGILMILQPDIGTLAIIIATSLIVYYAGGGKARHILSIILIGIFGLALMLKMMPYQADRFKCYVNPDYSANDKCYQINQSLIALGSGGIYGRGLGASRQKFMYVPEVWGDSIFAIIGEETGLIFSSFLIILFLYLFYQGYKIAKRAPDNFGRNLAIGIVSWLVIQAFINIGGIINLLPMTGVPLPFISYGGSAMLAALSAVGILVNISRQSRSA